MLKNALAMIVIGSLVAGSSFANPLHLEKMMLKNHMIKSPSVTSKHIQTSQSKFSGTWAGSCQYANEDMEIKIQIIENGVEFKMIDLIFEGDGETHWFDMIESEGKSDKDWYDSFTSRLTRVDENTFKHEHSGVFGNQLPSSDRESELMSLNYTSMYAVNNNQLTINTNGMVFGRDGSTRLESKCILKRVE